MTKPKHLYIPPEERTGNQVRTPAQLEALAKGRARYMEKVAERKAAEKKENGGNELNWLKNKKAKCAGQGNIHSL